jgi:LmbE family N-acetylglucosaminyl deacetylase
LREAEERNGAALVGVHNVEFLGFPDGLVEYGIELRRAIAAAIRRLQPHLVLTMNFDLTWGPGGSINHADHRVVGLATIDAVRDAANRWLFTEDGEPWSGVRATYVFATPEPTHYVDVSDTIEVAVASLQAHRGYLEGLGGQFDAGAFLRSNAESAATDLPCRYAVSLQAVP